MPAASDMGSRGGRATGEQSRAPHSARRPATAERAVARGTASCQGRCRADGSPADLPPGRRLPSGGGERGQGDHREGDADDPRSQKRDEEDDHLPTVGRLALTSLTIERWPGKLEADRQPNGRVVEFTWLPRSRASGTPSALVVSARSPGPRHGERTRATPRRAATGRALGRVGRAFFALFAPRGWIWVNPAMSRGQEELERRAADLASRLPEGLAPLARLAYNYRWRWHPGGKEAFRSIDAERWELCGENPVRLLQEASGEALTRAAGDRALLQRVSALEDEVEADLRRPWVGPIDPERPIAFFCAEYGVHRSLPIYSGGLGGLAGDFLKEASDRAVPLVAVGLMYRQGLLPPAARGVRLAARVLARHRPRPAAGRTGPGRGRRAAADHGADLRQ